MFTVIKNKNRKCAVSILAAIGLHDLFFNATAGVQAVEEICIDSKIFRLVISAKASHERFYIHNHNEIDKSISNLFHSSINA